MPTRVALAPVLAVALAALLLGCDGERVLAAGLGTGPVVAPPAPPLTPPPAVPRAFGPEVRTLRLTRSTVVKLGPAGDAKNLGAVAADTRVEPGAAAVGPGCRGRWIAIRPRGWICEDFVAPSGEPPGGVELPKLGRGERMPGRYGKVTGKGARIVTLQGDQVVGQRAVDGSTMVRQLGERVIGGQPHWQIGKDEFVRASAISLLPPPAWRGVRLGDETGRALPLGFATSAKHVLDRVPVWAEPAATTRRRTLAPREVIAVVERDAAGAIRIGDGEWVRADDVRLVESAPPPPGLEPGERWIDIDLDRQTLVAYEGDLPVFATLVSSGRPRTPTQTGLFRVWVKFAETDMNGQMADEPSYSVATVPWTQFYVKDLALHTAYWHDRFGTPRSHGCVNLSPADARFLYFWSTPDVPPGWSMAHGVVERPGSMIRVRSAADPEPVPRGYAARVAEMRGSPGAPGSARVAP